MKKNKKEVKKEEPSLDQKIERMLERIEIVVQSSLKDMSTTQRRLKLQIATMANKTLSFVENIDKRLESNSKQMKDVAITEEFVLGVLNNLLTAIRQNENLQAWYPAQCGYPAMKVSGIHPANIPKNEEKEEDWNKPENGWSDLNGD